MLNIDQYATSRRYEARIYLNTKFKVNPESKFRWIFDRFPHKADARVLELGCGTGLFWLANRQVIPPGWSITLSDYSEGMLRKTRQALAAIDRQFICEVVNAGDIRYPAKHFDAVLANNMLYHVENRQTAISRIASILKDDGVFLASTRGKNDTRELHQLFSAFLAGRGKKFSFREFAFSLDNGRDQLLPHFADVALERFDDALRIDEVEPIVQYFLSFNAMHDNVVVLAEEDVDPLRTHLRGILASQKAIAVTKDSGLFLCTHPRV